MLYLLFASSVLISFLAGRVYTLHQLNEHLSKEEKRIIKELSSIKNEILNSSLKEKK